MEPTAPVIECESDMAKKCELTVYASCRTRNSRNSESADELFSDAEEKKSDLTYYSPEVPKADQSSLNLSDLPEFLTEWQATTPNTAVIPSTPLSLIPFLTRVNEQWTSDLETPQSEKTKQTHLDPAAKSVESAEKVPVSKPPSSSMSQPKSDGEYISSSPVIQSKKSKRRPKRRIFKTMHSPESASKTPKNEADNDNSSACLTTCVTKENVSHSEVIENNLLVDKQVHTDEKKRVNTENGLNTSTQNFFSNMSFTNIDEICAEDFETQSKRSQSIENENKGRDATLVLPNVVPKNLPKEFGFQTASGKAINISKSALSKVQTLFGEDFNDSSSVSTAPVSKKNDEEKNYSLFQFANGKPVKLHPEALKRAETLFTNELCERNNEDTVNPPLKQVELSNHKEKEKNAGQIGKSMVGFQTASGQPITISRTALERARTIFSEDMKNDEESTSTGKEVEHPTAMEKQTDFRNVGFKTAGGHPMTVTKAALQKVSSLFSEDTEDSNANSKQNDANNVIKTISETSFGFHTASGRQIAVSETALRRAKSLFAEDTEHLEVKEDSREDRLNHVKTNKRSHSGLGFQSASGRQVAVSEGALYKVKWMFSEDIESPKEKGDLRRDSLNIIADNKHRDSGCGFQTASGRPITVSETALQKAKSLFLEDTEIPKEKGDSRRDSMNIIAENKPRDSGCGFQTASGRPINVSETALQKAKSLFSEDVEIPKDKRDSRRDSLNIIPENKARVSGCGFQTASGRPIAVSETALKKVKSLLSEVEEPEEPTRRSLNIPNNKSSNFGCGREIVVSETALQKVQAAFHEELVEDMSNSLTKSQSSFKRKTSEIDDNTPLKSNSNTSFKKLRFNNEFSPRKLTYEDTTYSLRNKETQGCKQEQIQNNKTNNIKRLSNNNCSYENASVNKGTTCEDLISEEILASTEAFLADEGKSVPEPKTPSSPVIGRQSNARRKRSLTLRNRNLNRLYTKGTNPENLEKRIKEAENQAQSTIEKQEKAQTATDYGDTQLILNFIDNSGIVLQKRIEAAMDQESLIKQKARNKPKSQAGRLFSYKQQNPKNRVTWKEVTSGNPPVLRSYHELVMRKLPPETLNVTATTAADYRFRCSDFYGHQLVQENTNGIDIGENTFLILDENGYAGIREMKRSFLAIPTVDPRLIPTGWVENHYKWIVWKLASMDRSKFLNTVLPRTLTPAEVIAQLKYRYDREIDRVQRPAIRKILEKDDVPSKRMVLCVSSILEHSEVQNVNTSPKSAVSPIKKLILTDGWYSIPASVDRAMLRNICSRKVREGTKLVISGAELLNCDQGCFPLEAPGDVSLRIHTNSTRRARWDAKLGYSKPPRPIPTKLKNICPNGGLVGRLMIVVARVYPVLYYEKTATGESIFRNARCEEKANLSYERECSVKTEAFYAKAENQFYNPKKPASSSSSDPDSMELAAKEWNGDYEKLVKDENMSCNERRRLLDQCKLKEEEFKKKLNSRLQASLPPQRQVRPLLKVRIVEGEESAILSVWVPGEDVVDMLKEGSSLCLYNVSSSGQRAGELQLTAGRSTLFVPQSNCNVNYPRRICYSLYDLRNPSLSPAYNEFDTVGIVVYVGSGPYGMKHFEAVYLACPSKDSSETCYLSILFWQGIATHGYAEMLTPGSLIACSNLEKRRAMSSNIPIAYSTERTLFTRNPRQKHLSQPLSELRTMKVDLPAYVRKCAEEVAEEVLKKPLPKTPDCSLDRTVSETSNIVTGTNNVAERSSPFSNSYTPRSSAVQMRLEKLNYYAEPPQLSPMVLKTSKQVMQSFQSPVRSFNIKGDQSHK